MLRRREVLRRGIGQLVEFFVVVIDDLGIGLQEGFALAYQVFAAATVRTADGPAVGFWFLALSFLALTYLREHQHHNRQYYE